MRPGPRPRPSKALELHGSWRAKQRSADELRVEAAAPTMPKWLPDEARTHWRRLVRALAAVGVLARADGNALARYVHSLTRWLKLAADVGANGEAIDVPTSDGGTRRMVRCETKLLAELDAALLRLEREFGLTPAARVGLRSAAAPAPPTAPVEFRNRFEDYGDADLDGPDGETLP